MPSPGCGAGLYNGRVEVSRRIVPASLEEPQVPSGDNIIGKARRVNVMQWDWLFSGGRERFSGRLEGGLGCAELISELLIAAAREGLWLRTRPRRRPGF